jgi:hypothetical protein
MERGKLLSDVDPAQAARTYQLLLRRYPKRIDPAEVMRLVADCHRAAGRIDLAWRWLTKAHREHPGASYEIDGRRLSVWVVRIE